MNDQRFFDLAMKAIAHQSTDAERAELEALVSSQADLKAEWERLQADSKLAREVLPHLAVMESSTPEFPAYARERLQSKVRLTLGHADASPKRSGWNWRWIFGVAAGAAVVLFLALPLSKPAAPVVQMAVLDLTGAVRGAETDDLKMFQEQWKGSTVQSFARATELDAWQAEWPEGTKPAAKVIYDRAAGELRVFIRSNGETNAQTFVVEKDLGATLQQVKSYLAEKLGR